MSNPNTIHRIPLAQIDEAALVRDRSVLDARALEELRLSIASPCLRPKALKFCRRPRRSIPRLY